MSRPGQTLVGSSSPQGTLEYLAPEMFDEQQQFDPKVADVFAAGMCLEKLLVGVAGGGSAAAARLLGKLANLNLTLT